MSRRQSHDKNHRLGRQKAVTGALNDLERQTRRLLELMRKAGSDAEKQAIRDRIQKQVDALEHCYQETRNPLFCWRALLAVHDFGLPMPEWITTYLYNGALELVNGAYTDDPPGEIPKYVYYSLGFDISGQGGARGQFKTTLQLMAALDSVVDSELAGENKGDAAIMAAQDLIDGFQKNVTHDIESHRQKRLRYDRRSGEYRTRQGTVTESLKKLLSIKHGRKLSNSIRHQITPENAQDKDQTYLHRLKDTLTDARTKLLKRIK